MTLALGERRLCAAIIYKAVVDAQADGNDRAAAVTWLASRQAEQWFDLLDMSQSSFLVAAGWADWAEEVLTSDLSEKQRHVIKTTLTYLSGLRARKESWDA